VAGALYGTPRVGIALVATCIYRLKSHGVDVESNNYKVAGDKGVNTVIKLVKEHSWFQLWLDDKFVGLIIPVPGAFVASVNGKVISDEDKDVCIERALALWQM
jgi:hypothetical protein